MATKFVSSMSGLTEEEKEHAVDGVICMRVSDLQQPHAPSTQQDGAVCGTPVWVSLTSPKTPPKWCMECTVGMVGAKK